jgi:hypothetical protein
MGIAAAVGDLVCAQLLQLNLTFDAWRQLGFVGRLGEESALTKVLWVFQNFSVH